MNEWIIPRRPADTSRITLRDGADVCYWTTELDASEEELVLAMREVGPTAIAVRAYFRTHAHSPRLVALRTEPAV